jgi:hypothetical protein
MKCFILSFALMGASTAFAGSVEQMVQQCHDVMICEECRVAADTRVYPSGTRPILIANKRYDVPVADYNWIRNAGYTKAPSGEFLMCERVKAAMVNPNSMRGLVARSSFSADYDGRGYCPAPKVALWDRVLALFTAN